jgi:hypothetical protein
VKRVASPSGASLAAALRAPAAQGQCGSCWAVAATGILGDRFCVHKAEFDKPIDVAADGASVPALAAQTPRGGSVVPQSTFSPKRRAAPHVRRPAHGMHALPTHAPAHPYAPPPGAAV